MEAITDPGLPPDHLKLVGFQEKIREILLKRIAEEDEKLKKLKKEQGIKVEAKNKLKEKLHEIQKSLQREQKEILELQKQCQDISANRRNIEHENSIVRSRLGVSIYIVCTSDK